MCTDEGLSQNEILFVEGRQDVGVCFQVQSGNTKHIKAIKTVSTKENAVSGDETRWLTLKDYIFEDRFLSS